MPSGGGPGLQSRVGGNDVVPGGFDSHPFRLISPELFDFDID